MFLGVDVYVKFTAKCAKCVGVQILSETPESSQRKKLLKSISNQMSKNVLIYSFELLFFLNVVYRNLSKLNIQAT